MDSRLIKMGEHWNKVSDDIAQLARIATDQSKAIDTLGLIAGLHEERGRP